MERHRSLRRSILDSFEDSDGFEEHESLSPTVEFVEVECTVTVGGDDSDDEPDSGVLEDYLNE